MAWRPSKRTFTAPTRGLGHLLAGMRIRKKLVVLHTCFSLVFAAVLAVAMRPAIHNVVAEAELHEATVLLDVVMAARGAEVAEGSGGADEADRLFRARLGPTVTLKAGNAVEVGVDPGEAERLRLLTYGGVARGPGGEPMAIVFDPRMNEFVAVSVTLVGARAAVVQLYVIATLALLAVYGLVAITLELFILPQHVYGPIRTMLRADAALRDGRVEDELIPDQGMPADELGEIMHSRNESVRFIRRHESDLAAALRQLEEVANDLRRKNHLLEMARRNLADADRLASVGMMSAGIAHELNTPLAVLKGLVERLHASAIRGGDGGRPSVSEPEAALMVRVVGRLERLSESLLDFARVRPHRSAVTALSPLIDEAWTLVRLDREARHVECMNEVPPDLGAWCDPDRMVQVMVNLLRNAVDAMYAALPGTDLRIRVTGEGVWKEGRHWSCLTIRDNGPGLAPEILGRLFQPFASTRLDARGTGLGLAVAEGIVREHGGVILARNAAPPARGAIFEITLPATGGEGAVDELAVLGPASSTTTD